MNPTPLETALRLAAIGFSVIPLKARDKRPALQSWKEYQTRRASEDEIRAWFGPHPDRNVGLVTGAVSGVVVIDADSEAMAARVSQQFPSPTRTKTSKGAHFFYRHPGRTVGNKAKVIGLNLDVRGDGGYVVAPGSIHPTGVPYQEDGNWDSLESLPIFQPSWLGESKPHAQGQNTLRDRIQKYLDRTPGAIQGQAGDPHTFRVACKLVRGYDLSDSEALDYLSLWNSKCTPPWSITELKVKIHSARTTGTGSFGYLLSSPQVKRPAIAQSPAGISVDEGGAGNLQDVLARNERGAPKKTPGNLAKILRLDESWGQRLTLNEMTRDVLLDGIPMGDGFIDMVQEQIEDRFGLPFGREEVASKILSQASLRTMHPVRDWLQSIPEWDGIERIHRVAEEVLNSDGYPIYTHYIRCVMVGAVRRIFVPGTKVDTICVLVGGQGYFKSTFWRILASLQWFSDSPIDLDSKDGMLTLHRAWFTELGEIDHMTSLKAAERIKGFASSCADTFRPPFARSVAVFPRSCMIVGTTNRDRFLNDPTGSRRFWPIKILSPINISKLEEWREQLWAEALNLYAAEVDHWLSPEHDAQRAAQSQGFECEDPWDGQFALAWERFNMAGRPLSRGVSIAEILDQMGIPVTQQNRGASMKLAEILKANGWTRNSDNNYRLWRPPQYGQQLLLSDS